MNDLPVVKGPLILNGKRYGDIVIRENGAYGGVIEDPEVHARIVAIVMNGLCDGFQLTCNLVPGVPISEESKNNA